VQTRTHAQKYFQKLQRAMEVSWFLFVVVNMFTLIVLHTTRHMAQLLSMFLNPFFLLLVQQFSARGRFRRRTRDDRWIWNHIR